MTDYKATPAQWRQIENSQVFNGSFQACVLELRSRVEKLEMGAGIRDLVAEGVKDTFKPTSNSRQIRSSLSPGAQAVLDAFGKYPLHGDHIAETLMHGALPAALRAAIAHTQQYQGKDCYSNEVWTCDSDELLAIADELEQLDA